MFSIVPALPGVVPGAAAGTGRLGWLAGAAILLLLAAILLWWRG